MTSPSAHLDLDALADALAGAGSEADASHLADCGSCAGRLGELRAADRSVLVELRALAAPALPPDVQERLDAALAAQEPLAPTRAASVTALPTRRAHRSGDRTGWLAAAAAAVIVLGGGAFALSQGGLDQGGADSSTSAAGGSAELAAPAVEDLLLTASGADWADPATPGTTLPQVLGGQATAYQLTDETPLQARSSEESDEQAAAESQGEQDADAGAAQPGPAAALPEADEELARLRTGEGLQACLSSLLTEEQLGTRPLAVDYATYGGEPALAVVLPDPDPARASIFVVGSDCSAADPDVLLFRRAPLP